VLESTIGDIEVRGFSAAFNIDTRLTLLYWWIFTGQATPEYSGHFWKEPYHPANQQSVNQTVSMLKKSNVFTLMWF